MDVLKEYFKTKKAGLYYPVLTVLKQMEHFQVMIVKKIFQLEDGIVKCGIIYY